MPSRKRKTRKSEDLPVKICRRCGLQKIMDRERKRYCVQCRREMEAERYRLRWRQEAERRKAEFQKHQAYMEHARREYEEPAAPACCVCCQGKLAEPEEIKHELCAACMDGGALT